MPCNSRYSCSVNELTSTDAANERDTRTSITRWWKPKLMSVDVQEKRLISLQPKYIIYLFIHSFFFIFVRRQVRSITSLSPTPPPAGLWCGPLWLPLMASCKLLPFYTSYFSFFLSLFVFSFRRIVPLSGVETYTPHIPAAFVPETPQWCRDYLALDCHSMIKTQVTQHTVYTHRPLYTDKWVARRRLDRLHCYLWRHSQSPSQQWRTWASHPSVYTHPVGRAKALPLLQKIQ